MCLVVREEEELLKPVEHFEFHADPFLDSIKQKIDEIQPDIVLVDSLDKVKTAIEGQHYIVRQTHVVDELMDQCNSLGHVLLIIHHLNKAAGHDDIDLGDFRGASHIGQQTAHTIGVLGRQGDNRIRVVKVVSRRYQELDLTLYGNPETFIFTEVEEEAFD